MVLQSFVGKKGASWVFPCLSSISCFIHETTVHVNRETFIGQIKKTYMFPHSQIPELLANNIIFAYFLPS